MNGSVNLYGAKFYNDYDGISLLVDDRILSYCIRKKNILGMWVSLFLSIAIRRIKKLKNR